MHIRKGDLTLSCVLWETLAAYYKTVIYLEKEIAYIYNIKKISPHYRVCKVLCTSLSPRAIELQTYGSIRR